MTILFRPHFTCSQSEAAQKAFDKLTKDYQQYDIDDATHIIPLGGDGHMLRILHRYMNRNIPVFGMNRGSYGFLMNRYAKHALAQRVLAADSIQLFPLDFSGKTTTGDTFNGYAFNEVSVLRSCSQAAKLRINVDGVQQIRELMCDGTLLATPAGSTAYNRACHGPILPFVSKALALTPVSPFKPRWKGAILPDTAIVEIENLSPNDRSTIAAGDFLEFPDMHYVRIYKSETKTVKLLFDPDFHLADRILREQFDE